MTTAERTSIGDVVNTLAAIKRVRKEEVYEAIGMKKATWFRRYRNEDWSALEVKQLAAYFGVPVDILYRDPEDLIDIKSRFFGLPKMSFPGQRQVSAAA